VKKFDPNHASPAADYTTHDVWQGNGSSRP